MVEYGAIPLALFLLTAFIWALTAFQSSRLLRKFEAKYPAVAAKEIPYAFSHIVYGAVLDIHISRWAGSKFWVTRKAIVEYVRIRIANTD
jgi:hypothetical protein